MKVAIHLAVRGEHLRPSSRHDLAQPLGERRADHGGEHATERHHQGHGPGREGEHAFDAQKLVVGPGAGEQRPGGIGDHATREDAERLALLCEQLGRSAVGLSGKLTQSSRNAVMQAFATGKHQVLVTTDLASRGLDLLQVSHVINFDLPKHAEEYVHRIGRTGRAGAKGQAISLVGPKDIAALERIEAFLRQPTSFTEVEGLGAKFDGKPKVAKAAVKAVAGKKALQGKAKAKTKAVKPLTKNAPQFFEGGDDGLAPVRRKQK